MIDAKTARELDPYLMAFAMRSVRDAEEARELVQETWEAALRGQFAGRSTLRTYLTGILRRRIADRHRARYRRPLALEEHAHHVPPAEARSEEHLDRQTRLRHVNDALEKMPRREREVLLRISHGDARDVVAEDLDLTRVHLRVLLHRARRQLRAAAGCAA